MRTPTDHISARERRGDERHIVRLDATVRAYRMPTLDAAVVDLSAGGAMLEADARAFGNGDEILLTTGQIEIVATIAWLNDKFFGLAFHRRLDSYELDMLRKGHA